MNIVTLDEIKAHCRIDTSTEDSLLELYADAAEATVLNYIWRDLDEVYDIWGKVPEPLKVAVLLLVENEYTNRSLVSITNMYRVPYTFDALVDPYKKLS